MLCADVVVYHMAWLAADVQADGVRCGIASKVDHCCPTVLLLHLLLQLLLLPSLQALVS